MARPTTYKKNLNLWSHACSILGEYLSNNTLGEWVSMHQLWPWKSTLDECYLSHGENIYECILHSRRKRIRLLKNAPQHLTFDKIADVYEYSGTIYLISTILSISPQQKTSSFDCTVILGDMSIPRPLTREIAQLIRKGRLIVGSDGSEKEGVAHFAWGLLDVNNMIRPLLQFKTPMHGDVDQTTPLCAELLGLFSALHFICSVVSKYNLKRSIIPVYSDCQNAIDASTTPFFISYKSVFLDDSDIRSELHIIYKKFNSTFPSSTSNLIKTTLNQLQPYHLQLD